MMFFIYLLSMFRYPSKRWSTEESLSSRTKLTLHFEIELDSEFESSNLNTLAQIAQWFWWRKVQCVHPWVNRIRIADVKICCHPLLWRNERDWRVIHLKLFLAQNKKKMDYVIRSIWKILKSLTLHALLGDLLFFCSYDQWQPILTSLISHSVFAFGKTHANLHKEME